MLKHLLALAACLLLAGCQSVVTSGGGGGAGTATTAGAGGAATTPGASSSGGAAGLCPPSPPGEGASCAGFAGWFLCTYGDSVRPDCRDAWHCGLYGAWTHTPWICNQPPPGACESAEPASGTPCASSGAECVHGDSYCTCGCIVGTCEVPLVWHCSDPPAAPGCPAVIPNAGTPCAVPATCVYDHGWSPGGAQATCEGSQWVWNSLMYGGG